MGLSEKENMATNLIIVSQLFIIIIIIIIIQVKLKNSGLEHSQAVKIIFNIKNKGNKLNYCILMEK